MEKALSFVFLAAVVLTCTKYCHGERRQNLWPFTDGRVREPGIPCGNSRCLYPEAVCTDVKTGACECKNNLQGYADLACLDPRDSVCTIVPVSFVFNYDADIYRVPVPCRYLVSMVDTRNITRGASCRNKVYAFGQRLDGNFFPTGFEVQVTSQFWEGRGQWMSYRASSRPWGDGAYVFTLEMKSGPKAKWVEIPGIRTRDVQFYTDQNARIVLHLTTCGVQVFYRPMYADRKMVPGLMVAVSHKTQHADRWSTLGESVCLTPTAKSHGPNAMDIKHKLGFSNVDMAFTYLAFTTNVKEFDPYTTPMCETVSSALLNCTNREMRILAMDLCHFILDAPLFLHCMAGDGTDPTLPLTLYGLCMVGICQRSADTCADIQSVINDSPKCRVFAFDSFMEFDCSSLKDGTVFVVESGLDELV